MNKDPKFTRKVLGTILASAMIAGLSLTAYAATSWRSEGVIVYDKENDGDPEVIWDTDDLNRLETAIDRQNTRITDMEDAIKNATGKNDIIEGINDIDNNGAGTNGSFVWNKDGTYIGYKENQKISSTSKWDQQTNPNNAQTSTGSSNFLDRVVEFKIPAGFYDGDKSMYVDLKTNNDYYYIRGYAEYLRDQNKNKNGSGAGVITYYDKDGNTTTDPDKYYSFSIQF